MGELLEITQRSRRPSESAEEQETEIRGKDWPQYLTEQELEEMMRIMQEKAREEERLRQLQEDGTFENQYDSSMIHHIANQEQQYHEEQLQQDEDVLKLPPPIKTKQVEDVNTIIVDGQEVDIHQESVLNYEDMQLLNGQDESHIVDPYQNLSQSNIIQINNNSFAQQQHNDGDTFNLSPMTPYQKLREIKMRKAKPQQLITNQSKATISNLSQTRETKRDRSFTSESKSQHRPTTTGVQSSNILSRRIKVKPQSELRGTFQVDKSRESPSRGIMTAEQRTKLKIHQLIKKKKNNLIMKNQGLIRNQSKGTAPPTFDQLSTNTFPILSPAHAKKLEEGTEHRVRNNDYFHHPSEPKVQGFKEKMLLTLGNRQFRPQSGMQNNSLTSLAQVNQIMMNGVQRSNTDSLSMLDMLLQRDQQINGVEVYQTGEDLKKGLIDIDKVYDVVLQKEKEKDPDFVHEVRPISRQEKWKRVMAYMSSNPMFLLDSLPNVPRQQAKVMPNALIAKKKSTAKPKNSDEDQLAGSSKLKSRLQKDLDLSKKLNQKQHTYGAPTKYGNFFDQQQERPFSFNEQRPKKRNENGLSQTEPQSNNGREESKSSSRYHQNEDSQAMYILNQKEGQKSMTPDHDDQLSFGLNTRRDQQEEGSSQQQYSSGKKQQSRTHSQQPRVFDRTLQSQVDWKYSLLYSRLDSNPYKSDASLYTNEDIDYMINLVRRNESTLIQKQWTATTLKQMVNKVLHTIRTQCEEMELLKLSEKIYLHYHFPSTDNLIKLFFRCKEFFIIRARLVQLLKNIGEREHFLEGFQSFVREMNQEHNNMIASGDHSQQMSDKDQQLTQMLAQLKILTQSIASEILAFLGDYRKYFGKVFLFEGEDYIEVSRRETSDIEYVIGVIGGGSDTQQMYQ
ncbi:hypothetical protein FGO68_gene16634 [Halteria grandinella]|uniref:Uncharacterized protein n=1 Tax=Halteria grandinella TaxID=5974 RepID=A0A8J8SXU2_HALGN|nr:hypothetical protein FGO68_gene16634 [Halteria grandinella]